MEKGKMDKLINQTQKILEVIDPEQVLVDDISSQYPSEFGNLKIHQWIVPEKFGGELGSIEELFIRGQILASKNVTSAIALGQCFLGSLPVWISGSDELKQLAASKLLNSENCCLALTEKDHGSDLYASETSYRQGLLNGEKWCINNATKGTCLSVLTTSDQGLSVLFLDKSKLDNKAIEYLPKIRTHGIKGADISGIRFSNCAVPRDAVVGRQGKGLDIVAKTLQVSRTLCSAFSVGSLQACLNMTEEFAAQRKLYGKTLNQIDAPAKILEKARQRLELITSFSRVMCRMVTLYPEVISLYSAVTKYLVPKITSETIDLLAEVMGARSYLNDEEYPLFEKFKRDHSVVPLFDGSSAVNLFIISGQMKNIQRHLCLNQAYPDVFNFDEKVPHFTGEGLRLSNRGADIIFSHYKSQRHQHELLEKNISRLEFDLDPFSYEARINADLYARVMMGACGVILDKEIGELFCSPGL